MSASAAGWIAAVGRLRVSLELQLIRLVKTSEQMLALTKGSDTEPEPVMGNEREPVSSDSLPCLSVWTSVSQRRRLSRQPTKYNAFHKSIPALNLFSDPFSALNSTTALCEVDLQEDALHDDNAAPGGLFTPTYAHNGEFVLCFRAGTDLRHI